MQFKNRKHFLTDSQHIYGPYDLNGPLCHCTPLQAIEIYMHENNLRLVNDMQFTNRELFLVDGKRLTDRTICTDRNGTAPLLGQ